MRGGGSKQARGKVVDTASREEIQGKRRTIMKKTLAVLFTAMAMGAMVGCDERDAMIESEREANKDALNAQKEAVNDATATAKKQAEANADANKARLEAQQQSAQAQIEADKKKVDAQAEAAKEVNDAQKKVD